MTGQVPPTQHAEIMEIMTVAGPFGGASHQFIIETQPDAVIGDAIFRTNQSLRLYADPGRSAPFSGATAVPASPRGA